MRRHGGIGAAEVSFASNEIGKARGCAVCGEFPDEFGGVADFELAREIAIFTEFATELAR